MQPLAEGLAPMFGRCLIIFIWLAFFCIAITQAQSGCGGSKSTSSGNLTSPGYPANVASITDRQNSFRTCYPKNQYYYTDCLWTITIPDQQQVIELTITDMEFTQNECCRNYIEVRDGLMSSDPLLAGPCGTGSFPPILSSGNKLRVALRSSNETSGHKFQASWKTVCRRTFTSDNGQLQSPGHPSQYPNDNTCTYLIEQPRGFQIQIQFTQFRLDDADSSGNCLDFLEIYDGPTDSNPKLGTSPSFCGSTSPGLLTSTRSQVFIKFYSDSRTSTGSSGFAATFSRKAPECITRTNLPGSGVITSPGFPRPFPLAATCTWEITIPRSSLIDFTFHTIELGPDNEDILDCGNTRVKTVVSLYEVGIGDTETLLVRYCRRNVFSNVITTSTTSKRKLKVVFESKNLDSSSVLSSPVINGFNASYISRVPSGYASDDVSKLVAYGTYTSDLKLIKLGSDPVAVPLEPHVQVGHKRYRYALECCYKYDRSEPSNEIYLLVQDKPDAATLTAYNPFFPETYRHYVQEDKMAYDDCCLKSNSLLCDKFYELRPVGDCESDPPFVFAWLCCDIVTLDERGYTFNGWGEYTMVTASSPVAFTLQARTDLVETESGKLSNATVFTAFGAEENRIRVFFGLDPNTKNSLVIYAKGEDFSRRFKNDSAFQVDTDDFFLRRNNDSAELSFPSGVNFRVSVRVKSLMMSLSLPKTFRNKTRGLLGNFNGIKSDDFILPNGTSLSPDLTERQIFQTFGPAWAVTTDNSVMRYEEREGPLHYSHPLFVPLFFDEQSETVKNEAKAKCGDNLACQYDFFATESEAFALDCKRVKEEADMTNKALKNSVPLLKVPSTLKVTARQVHTFRITGTDVDGDSLTYHVEDDGNGRVQIDSITGDVTFTPTDTPIEMRFYARDSRRAKSPPQSVEVFVCSGCNGNGICDFSSTVSREGEAKSYLFHRAECVCNRGWEGEDCETPRDDCADNPCMEGQNCIKLTPQEQGNSVLGFKCGKCPVGFTKWTSDIECHDVDECDDVPKVCEMACVNTYGSFECGCRAGYRLENNGRSCVDVNECQEKTSNCQQICTNTVGGYTCGCEAGYNLDNSTRNTCKQTEEFISACRYSDCTQGCKPGIDPATNEPALQCFCFAGFDNITEDGSECRNHDECQDTENPCSQRCYDNGGGFSCSCYDGYYLAEDTTTCLPCSDGTYGPSCLYWCRCSGQGVDCDNVKGCVCKSGWRGGQCQDDIDECTDNPNRCMSDEECLNTPGSYTCRCLSGFEKNSRTGACTDVDECSDLSVLNTCGERQTCKNVPGSFYCTCMQGYTLFNGQCEDIDECSLGISDCEHQCTNLSGSYNCDCRYGYRLNTDRATCSEVSDVCAAEENLSCDHGCTLNDDDRAVCFCKVGFLLNADKQTCARTRTCITFNCSHACTTINDQPVCSCPPGKILNLDLKTCQDCPQGTFGVGCANNCSCGLGALQCNATTGCVCKNGWRGERCDRDLNECDVTSVSLRCQNKGATCKNTRGSYRCACLNGFEMDDTGMCQDVNECRDDRCGQQCENSPGSYRCLCSRGFSLDKASGSCKDIEECGLSATNRCTQTCINLDGRYRCACRPGFVLSADGVSCTIFAACNRTNCAKENGGCSEEQCFCDSGYQLSGSNACEPIRTNWCSVPVCEQECQEILNGLTPFLCSCKDGYILNDDKKTCREKEVASGCRRTDCPTENGGCSEEQCFCNIGYRLSDANMCQPTVTDWCAVASCEQGCNVTSDRSWFTCSCRDGCVLNIDKTTCRVGECNRKDCPTENGGCRMGLCFCDDGYELSEFEDQRCVLPRSKDEETPGSTDSTLAIGLGVGLGVLALVVVAVACYLYKKGQSSGIADDNRYVRRDSAPGTTASENPSWASV